MTDPIPTTTPAQAAVSVAPQAGVPVGQEPTEQFDADYVRKLRAENAQARKERQALEAQLATFQQQQKDAEAAKLSDLDRLRNELKDVTAKMADGQKLAAQYEQDKRAWSVRLAALTAAGPGRLNLVDPDAAWRLLDMAAVEFDEGGQPTNVDKLLDKLVKARPWLAGQPASNASAASATNAPRVATGTSLTRQDIERMSQAEINARWAEVSAVLARG